MPALFTADELESVLVRFLTDFVDSADGERVSQRVRDLTAEGSFVVRTREPSVEVTVDVLQRTVTRGGAGSAAARAQLHAEDLHNLMLDRLGPVEISRLSEIGRIAIEGEPDTLAALVMIAAVAQPYYPASLERSGRHDLLETPAPPVGGVWHGDGPPPRLIETRRPWQRRAAAPLAADPT